MDSTVLRAVAQLLDLENEGWLDYCEHAIAERVRGGPRDDLQRFPMSRFAVNDLARTAKRILGEPEWVCRQAAAEVILPGTRRQIVLRTIDECHRELLNAKRRAAS